MKKLIVSLRILVALSLSYVVFGHRIHILIVQKPTSLFHFDDLIVLTGLLGTFICLVLGFIHMRSLALSSWESRFYIGAILIMLSISFLVATQDTIVEQGYIPFILPGSLAIYGWFYQKAKMKLFRLQREWEEFEF